MSLFLLMNPMKKCYSLPYTEKVLYTLQYLCKWWSESKWAWMTNMEPDVVNGTVIQIFNTTSKQLGWSKKLQKNRKLST